MPGIKYVLGGGDCVLIPCTISKFASITIPFKVAANCWFTNPTSGIPTDSGLPNFYQVGVVLGGTGTTDVKAPSRVAVVEIDETTGTPTGASPPEQAGLTSGRDTSIREKNKG